MATFKTLKNGTITNQERGLNRVWFHTNKGKERFEWIPDKKIKLGVNGLKVESDFLRELENKIGEKILV